MKSEILSWSYKILLSALAFVSPIHGLMIALGGVLLIDFILGIMTAKKNGIPIQSKEAKKTVIKLLIYEITILTSFLLDSYFIPGNLVVRIAAMAIGLVEAKSIFEHIYILTGLNIWDLVKEKLQASVSSNSKSSSSKTSTSSDGTITTTTNNSTKSVEVPVKDPPANS